MYGMYGMYYTWISNCTVFFCVRYVRYFYEMYGIFIWIKIFFIVLEVVNIYINCRLSPADMRLILTFPASSFSAAVTTTSTTITTKLSLRKKTQVTDFLCLRGNQMTSKSREFSRGYNNSSRHSSSNSNINKNNDNLELWFDAWKLFSLCVVKNIIFGFFKMLISNFKLIWL